MCDRSAGTYFFNDKTADWFLYDTSPHQRCLQADLKGCVCYILASLFLSLKQSICENKKNVFYFTSKALFVLEKILDL